MSGRIRKLKYKVLATGVALFGLVISPLVAPAVSAPLQKQGMVCTNGSLAAGTRTFNLQTADGFIYTPEGNTIYSWGFTRANSVFQLPGPVLCVNEGETVRVNLTNNLPLPVSMLFPGQEGVSASGGACASPSDCLLVDSTAPASGGTVSYSFVAGNPGTYLYQSGTNQQLEVEMGLYGAIVVRPSHVPGVGALGTCNAGVASGPSYAYDAARTAFDPCRENILIMTEVDPDIHEQIEAEVNSITPVPIVADFTNRHPRYWLVNGRSFPDVIYANFVSWLPNQPYGGLVRVQPLDQTCSFDPNGVTGVPVVPAGCAPSMIRYINAGFDNHPFHPHGNDMLVIGRDARLLQGPHGEDTSFKDFARTVGAGQTYDMMFKWLLTCNPAVAAQNGQNWLKNTGSHTCDPAAGPPESNAIPIIPNYKNLEFKDNDVWYGGSPYLGYKGTLTVGVTTQNVCGEYYFPWHSHALNEFVNFDALFGGLATLVRVDPPPLMQHAGNCK